MLGGKSPRLDGQGIRVGQGRDFRRRKRQQANHGRQLAADFVAPAARRLVAAARDVAADQKIERRPQVALQHGPVQRLGRSPPRGIGQAFVQQRRQPLARLGRRPIIAARPGQKIDHVAAFDPANGRAAALGGNFAGANVERREQPIHQASRVSIVKRQRSLALKRPGQLAVLKVGRFEIVGFRRLAHRCQAADRGARKNDPARFHRCDPLAAALTAELPSLVAFGLKLLHHFQRGCRRCPTDRCTASSHRQTVNPVLQVVYLEPRQQGEMVSWLRSRFMCCASRGGLSFFRAGVRICVTSVLPVSPQS